MPRRLAAALFVIAGLSAVVGFAPSASATNTAQIRFVDRFDNGRVEASADQASAKLHNGEHTKWFTITPDSMNNDTISVTWIKYPGCGMGDGGDYFNPGHTYRVVISQHANGGRCGPHNEKAPGIKIVKVS